MTERPLPQWIYIYRTGEGWRHSIMGEGMACGWLGDVPTDAPVEQARGTAQAMIDDLADYYGAALRIDWVAEHCDADKSSGDLVPVE
jgi:hypothetical protein